jgi:hypothetical protein
MNDTTLEFLKSLLLWPDLFQMPLLHWVWGEADPAWLMWGKRLFLLLPILTFIGAAWVSTASLATLVVRSNRRQFSIQLIRAWWEMGYSVFLYWGGFFKAIAALFLTIIQGSRILLFGLWLLLQDLVLSPIYIARGLGRSLATPSFPWIAVMLTIIWCALESAVFAYVTTPLVIDTLSNLTGDALTENMIRPPLFLFMLFLILGSYSVLVTLGEAIKSRNVLQVIKIGFIEGVAMFVEIIFLYREFVDSLSPWFAQHMGGDFSLGLVGTIAIATITWLGVRSLSWFSFAAAGTPPLLALIHGSGIRINDKDREKQKGSSDAQIKNFIHHLHYEMDWFRTSLEQLGGAFLIPPIQMLAVLLNFVTLLLTGNTVFALPFKDLKDVVDTDRFLKNVAQNLPRRPPA